MPVLTAKHWVKGFADRFRNRSHLWHVSTTQRRYHDWPVELFKNALQSGQGEVTTLGLNKIHPLKGTLLNSAKNRIRREEK